MLLRTMIEREQDMHTLGHAWRVMDDDNENDTVMVMTQERIHASASANGSTSSPSDSSPDQKLNTWTHRRRFKDLFAVFVTNTARCTPLEAQRAGRDNDTGFVVFDYHCFLLGYDTLHERYVVWDPDSTLPFPADFSIYARKTFVRTKGAAAGGGGGMQSPRFYRIVEANAFITRFASDRRHMVSDDDEDDEDDAEDEDEEEDDGVTRISSRGWMAEPPSWPLIRGSLADGAHRLDKYIDVTRHEDMAKQGADVLTEVSKKSEGVVIDENTFIALFLAFG